MNRHIHIKISEEDYKALCKVIDMLELGESIMFPLDRWGHFMREYEHQRPEVIAALKLPPIEETGWPSTFAKSPANVNPAVLAKIRADGSSVPDVPWSATEARADLLEFGDLGSANIRNAQVARMKDRPPLSILNANDVDTLNGIGIRVQAYYRSRFTKKEGYWWLNIQNPKGAYFTYSEGYMRPHYNYPISRDRAEIKQQIWEAHLRAEADVPGDERKRLKREARARVQVDQWQSEWNGSGGE